MTEALSLPITVTCSVDKPQLSAKQIWMVVTLVFAIVGLTALSVFYLPGEEARVFANTLRSVGLAFSLWLTFWLKKKVRDAKKQFVIDTTGISQGPTTSPVKRSFDEFDHIEVVKKNNDACQLHRIIMRSKTGKENIIFDQPSAVGEAHAYNFARQLGQASNLKVQGNEWDN